MDTHATTKRVADAIATGDKDAILAATTTAMNVFNKVIDVVVREGQDDALATVLAERAKVIDMAADAMIA